MKIVGTDNFNRDNVDDQLIADNIKIEEYANTMCEALNKQFCNYDHAPTHFKVFPDDYKLLKWEP